MSQSRHHLPKEAEFREWLASNRKFTVSVVGDTCSRLRRLFSLIKFSSVKTRTDLDVLLLRCPTYAALTGSVRSQLKRAGALYLEFLTDMEPAKR